MEHPRPVLPSQRYSPASDYAYETDHEVMPITRTPLGESTGNIQPHNLAALALCNHSLSPPIHPIPTPPIVPTQALTSSYGTSLRGGRSLHRDVSLRESPMGYPRGSKNPIYAYKHFADYRNKVMQKELEKEQPIWPLWLEDAFLDALLLIPQMGRKKFSSKTILYGRNMLITEYLWIYHWLLHPPQNGEVIPNRQQREKGPDGKPHPMYRGRKQVSSHIQVLKGFFATLVTFHFIFPSKRDAKEEDRKLIRDDDDTESFKNNRVLISIADGRLPDERPNYEYFARLLSADNDVFLRPKQCWIFVSSSQVSLKEKHVKMDDGTTKKQVTGYTSNGQWLGESDYPHLKLNDGKEYKDLPRNGDQPTMLLHEYSRSISQKESSSIKDISNRWDVQFPELKEKLLSALDDTHPSDERSSRCVVGPCDTFQFEVTLDLHATSKFPDGSELNGMVELSINRPELHNHNWRSVTSVVKPDELHISGSEPDFWDRSNPVEVIVSHRVGCNGVGRCDCASRGSRDTIGVPFPAASWANTFIKLAPYVTAERERRAREQESRKGQRPSRTDRAMKKDDDAAGKTGSAKMPTPKELLSQVAMYQEIWSAPNDGTTATSGSEGSKRGWTRRAVVLWTFTPVHENTDDKGKTVTVAAGTNWKFLTKVDPTSEYHQQRAYQTGAPSIPRDSVMSPNPGFQAHVHAAMHENLSAAYDTPLPVPSTLPGQSHRHHSQSQGHGQGHHQQHAHIPPGLDLLDGFDNGLVTPPPTASLTGGYPHSFDESGSADSALNHHLSFISDGTSGAGSTEIPAPTNHNTNSTTDPFLSGLGVPVSTYEDPTGTDWAAPHGPGGLGLDVGVGGMNVGGTAWNPGYGVTWADTAGLTSATTSASGGEALWATAPNSLSGHESRDNSLSGASTGHWSEDKYTHHPHQQSSSGVPPDPWTWQGGNHAAWDVDTQDFSLNLGTGSGTGLTPLRSAQHSYPQQHHGGAQVAGRKRSREESVDAGDTVFPVHSMRKLSHPHPHRQRQGHVQQNAPTAVMDDGQGFL
ncbi:uncharacterized protein GGS22DRAFT_196414 [Annulohypoxylon maeteangense]|uniref:uncharacterized protein n=1 Tax=Annulohypoxylon maeteangense TaxID=1927788 RepID=UPI0020079FA8|nr:uncharacterized protein GGS22DRAFT_196414 [Annulohypoxylon maeteangense]KAI0881454.1 hypothetical protein GGS22DRAFT_196414 [Annulohypoxylon maeteangense]